MNEFFQKNLISVVAGVFILLFVPLFIFGVRFVVSMTQAKADEVRSIRIDQEINLDFLQSVSDLRRQSDVISDKREDLDILLADDANEKVQVFTQIEEVARLTGHSAFSYTLNKKAPKAKKKQDDTSDKDDSDVRNISPVDEEHGISLTMRMTGTYQNLFDFIVKLENFDYENDITKISLTAREGERSDVEARRFGSVRQGDQEDVDQRNNLMDSELTIVIYLDSLVEVDRESPSGPDADDESQSSEDAS